jgi:hypothetical protein
MSEIKPNFVIKKTTPNAVLFTVTSIESQAKREVFLTNRQPQAALPYAFAMDIFFNPGNYSLYKKGAFTFTDNEAAVRAAQEAGVYFSETLDFEPANDHTISDIVAILKGGNRAKIVGAIEKYGKDKMISVVSANLDDLTQGVINMLEPLLGVQLTLDKDE